MRPQSQPAVQIRYAYLWQRFVAVTLDEMLTIILFVPAFIVQSADMGGAWPLILFITAAILRFLYFVYFEHGKGQTIGKLLFRIRVRSESKDTLPLKEALIRNVRRFDVLMGLALPVDSSTSDLVPRITVALLLFYTCVAPIFIWQSEKKQRPLDMLAHTVVVQVEPPLPQA